MRDYWFTQDLLQAAGIGFILLSLAGIGLALWLPKKWWGKLLAVVAVGVLIAIPVRKAGKEMSAEAQEQQAREKDYKERYAKAKALFDERCKTAGEKVYRTVDNVEGVLLINPRTERTDADRANRDWPEAGFPGESGGNQYIMEFLFFSQPQSDHHGRELGWVRKGLRGYQYVDIEERGTHARYTLLDESKYLGGSDPVKGYGSRALIEGELPRYAISYEPIKDPDGRENWIAGGRVTVIDRTNGALLGEFVRYAFEPAFGNTDGGRSPWGHAVQCPKTNYGGSSGHIRSFVEQVIKPKQAE